MRAPAEIARRCLCFALAVLCCSLTCSCGGGGGGHATAGPQAGDTGEWSTVAPLQVSRQEVGVAALDGKVYVIGGTASASRISSVEIYDPAANTWTFAASLPGPALDH